MTTCVEIRGVGFNNKGAELMLYAIMQQLTLHMSGSTVAANLRSGSFGQRNQVGLHHLPVIDLQRADVIGQIVSPILNRLLCAMPLRIRHSLRLVCDSEVQVILDSSGFAYSDQQKPSVTESMARRSKRWKKTGKKIILLPQAFGPFRNGRIRDAMMDIVDLADLIFARDPTSYAHLLDLGRSSTHIKIAPDFTNLVEGRIPPYFNTGVRHACIIPNYRMIDKTSGAIGDCYLSFLTTCVEQLLERGLKPVLLLHETRKGDYNLASRLLKVFGERTQIIQEPNPLYIKGIIGSCAVVISSRYHGLVSALSQAVPSLATGWSHKYLTLLEDYNCADFLIPMPISKRHLVERLEVLLARAESSDTEDSLEQASLAQRKLTEEMWRDVFAVIAAR
jgi:polysaccharide pyruvyl transferase WcaK-like protein